ncbi:MAG: sulfatase, partial [Myxococcales bacterium]|nr:sulfatase [Myxococcales bacterium]
MARRTGAPPPRHVLVVSVDTLCADHLGLYGYARPTSPAIDALGARGVVFEHAMSTSSWTLPAHASLLTGRYPYQHRVQDDGARLGDDVPTLAEALRARGLATLAVVSHLYVASPFGLARGFDVFDDALIEGGTTNPRADAVVDRFLARLDAHLARGAEGGGARPDGAAAAPFFGFVHLFDPHWDYGAPAPYGRRFVDPAYRGPMDGSFAAMTPFVLAAGALAPADRAALVALYDGEIAWVDAQIARLLDALAARGVRDDTLVVITGDHGEEFGEHGRLGHGRTLFEEQLHVPLVVQHASLAPRRESAPASLVDVAATVLDALGGEADAFGAGRSLLAAAPAQAEPRERVLLAESIRYGLEWRAARRGPHKLVELADGAERWFFDLADDPAERRPAARDPSEDGALGAAFERFRSDADDGFQIKLVAHDGERLRLRARIEAQGPGAAIVSARHYASGHIAGREVRFDRFELVDGGAALEVDAVVAQHVGTIRFDVAPPGSAVRIATRELSLLAPGATAPAAVALRAADGTALGDDVRIERAGA